MLLDHPTVKDFEGFLQNPARPDRGVQNAQMIRHLLANCAVCCAQLETMGWPSSRLEHLVHLAGHSSHDIDVERPAQNSYNYDRAFERAEWAVTEFLAAAPRSAHSVEQLLAELDEKPLEAQQQLLARDERFVNLQLIKRLIDRSHKARYEDTERMLHWARLAHNLSMLCNVETAGGAGKLADLRARSGLDRFKLDLVAIADSPPATLEPLLPAPKLD